MSPAATDLGLGDKLRQETEDTIEERRKKKLALNGMTDLGGGAASQLFSAVGSFSI